MDGCERLDRLSGLSMVVGGCGWVWAQMVVVFGMRNGAEWKRTVRKRRERGERHP